MTIAEQTKSVHSTELPLPTQHSSAYLKEPCIGGRTIKIPEAKLGTSCNPHAERLLAQAKIGSTYQLTIGSGDTKQITAFKKNPDGWWVLESSV